MGRTFLTTIVGLFALYALLRVLGRLTSIDEDQVPLIVGLSAPLLYWLFSRPPKPVPFTGKCRGCGYDLRATPERCPECGMFVAVGEPRWPSVEQVEALTAFGTAGSRMMLRTNGFGTSVGDDERHEGVAYVHCVNDDGYCLSLSRFLREDLVGVLVRDQLNFKTREVAVELTRELLTVCVPPAVAAELDGIEAYVVPLPATGEVWRELDAALSVIFAGGNRGTYVRRFEQTSAEA